MILSYLKKKLGYHVCEEFTQWQRYCSPGGHFHWQEKRCTLCGKTYTEELPKYVHGSLGGFLQSIRKINKDE